jgi:signal transduction histidine kinase/ActR/RegA family two-component response regulator
MTEVLPNLAPIPANEAERLAALHRYQILDTPPEAAFDRITALAARLFKLPIVLVSLLDESRAWFKSCYGFEMQEVKRDATLCSFAVLFDDVFVVPDTRQDPRFVCNPFVLAEPGVCFYAGAPLLTHDGYNLGTLCLLDYQPHEDLSDEQRQTLADLAAMVVDELELRSTARKVSRLDTAIVNVTQSVDSTTGESFFYALVQQFTQALDVSFAYISRVVDQDHLQTIAICADGETAQNYEYCRQTSLCDEVLRQRKICCYPRDVRSHFPQVAKLEEMQAESYIGAPVIDTAGELIGVVGIVDRKPMQETHLAESLLAIFALRIATELARQQSEAQRLEMLVRERRYAEQLRGLTEAALAVNAVISIDQVLQVITEQARSIIGAHQAVTSIIKDNDWAHAKHSMSLSEKYVAWENYDAPPDGSGIYSLICRLNHPMRLTQTELEAHPNWRGFSSEAANHPPLRGWLAAPLTSRNGRNLGVIQLSDKNEGEFTAEDEDILVQLAQMASIAIANSNLYEAEQSARIQAESANRVKDEFLAVLSHELRTPLNPILGWSKILQKRTSDVALKQGLETIERNAKLQTQLIEDLLDVSRILQGKMSLNIQSVNLLETIRTALDTVQLAAQAKSIQIETAISDHHIGAIAGDSSRVQQVIWNLLSNAVKFTPEGGQINVYLAELEGQAQIQVVDEGIGIAPEFLPYVFERFRQEDSSTTRKFGGLGLGLAIARQIVELHGGTIWATSAGEGQGATFTVRLPLLPHPSITTSEGSALQVIPAPDSLLNGLKILIVDDDADTRSLLEIVLQQENAIPIVAASAIEALQHLEQDVPDLLVSDIGMPEIDGYALIERLRSHPSEQIRQLPALALTAYAGMGDQKQAIQAGFQRQLAKPIDPIELVLALSQLVKPDDSSV